MEFKLGIKFYYKNVCILPVAVIVLFLINCFAIFHAVDLVILDFDAKYNFVLISLLLAKYKVFTCFSPV